MILNAVINLFLLLFTGVFSFLPVVSLSSIPVIGSSISGVLVWVVGMFNSLLVTFPYGQVVWSMFKFILGFEALMLLAKFFLGNHLPAHLN